MKTTKLKNLIIKYKRLLISVLIVLVCFMCFAVIYKTTLPLITTKYLDIKLNDNYNTYSTTISKNQVLKQTFITNSNIYGVGIMANTEKLTKTAKIDVVVKDYDTKEILATSSGEIQIGANNIYSTFILANKIYAGSPNKKYILEIIPNAEFEDEISFAISSENVNEDWILQIDETTQKGSLALTTVVDEVGSFIKYFYFAFALLSGIIIAVIYYLSGVKKVQIHTLGALAIFMVGMLYMFILPPYSAPDEVHHINQVHNTSSVIIGATDTVILNNYAHTFKRPQDTNAIIENANTTVFTYKEIINKLLQTADGNTTDVWHFKGSATQGYIVPYLLPSFVNVICRILHIGFVPMLILARMANLILYSILIYFAIKTIPFGKAIIITIALLPISMHLGASFSRDSLLIAFTLLLFAIFMKCITTKEKISLKMLIILGVISVIYAPLKITYFPLCLLVLLIPMQNFKDEKSSKIYKYTVLGISSLSFIISSLSTNLVKIFDDILNIFLPKVNASTDTIIKVADGDEVVYSVSYILNNLGSTIKLIVNTIIEDSYFIVNSLFGGNLGYFSIKVNDLIIIGFIIIFILSTIKIENKPMEIKPKVKISLLAIMTIMVMLVLFATITWTPIYYTTIYGLQGRYLLPVLPMLGVLMYNNMITVKKDITKQIIISLTTLNVITLLDVFILISKR